VTGVGDFISFGAGGQTITGTGTNDIYSFAKGNGADILNNGVATNKTATNELVLGAGVATNQLWLKRTGNNLEIDILGTKDSVMVSNWFNGIGYQLQDIKTADGSKIDAQIGQLVQTMASYSASHAAFNPTTATVMPTDPTLQSTMAAAWHH